MLEWIWDLRKALQEWHAGQHPLHDTLIGEVIVIAASGNRHTFDVTVMAFLGEAGGVEFGFGAPDDELPIQERRDCAVECLVNQAQRGQLPATVDLKGVSVVVYFNPIFF